MLYRNLGNFDAVSEAMANLEGTGPEAVKRRLEALPGLLGLPSDAAMAGRLGISAQRWNAAKRSGQLSKAVAELLIQKIPGMTYEWIWSGRGPAHLALNETTTSRRSRRP